MHCLFGDFCRAKFSVVNFIVNLFLCLSPCDLIYDFFFKLEDFFFKSNSFAHLEFMVYMIMNKLFHPLLNYVC